jgi:glycosyl-4,4'-diaponeurosporenoate acyltransferase
MTSWTDLILLIAVDSVVWAVLHIGVAWAGTRLPASLFSPQFLLFRPSSWEQGGRFYERALGVRRWKHLLPDGAPWFSGGFPKATLKEQDTAYLQRFVLETCRGETVHWIVLSAGGLFFLWNPVWLACCMVVYAVVANLPCIITQRYNRLRLARIVARTRKKSHASNKVIR